MSCDSHVSLSDRPSAVPHAFKTMRVHRNCDNIKNTRILYTKKPENIDVKNWEHAVNGRKKEEKWTGTARDLCLTP